MPGSVMYHEDNFGLKEHWKVLAAMTLVSISTFQYGLDFGIIGGLQAMVGFLKVSRGSARRNLSIADSRTDPTHRSLENRPLRHLLDTTSLPRGNNSSRR